MKKEIKDQLRELADEFSKNIDEIINGIEREDEPKHEYSKKEKVVLVESVDGYCEGEVFTLCEYSERFRMWWAETLDKSDGIWVRTDDIEPFIEQKQLAPEPKLLNGAVVCIESRNPIVAIVGKKYIFKDGRAKLEYAGNASGYKSLEDLNEQNKHYKFARLIEEGEK